MALMGVVELCNLQGNVLTRGWGVYLEIYSVFGYVPKETESGQRSRGPQTAHYPLIFQLK